MEVADPMDHYRQISSDLVRKSLQILELQSITQTQLLRSTHQKNVIEIFL